MLRKEFEGTSQYSGLIIPSSDVDHLPTRDGTDQDVPYHCRTTARSVTTTHANLEAHSYHQGSAAQCVVKTKHFRTNALPVLVMRRGACPGLGSSEYNPSAKHWLERFHANAACA